MGTKGGEAAAQQQPAWQVGKPNRSAQAFQVHPASCSLSPGASCRWQVCAPPPRSCREGGGGTRQGVGAVQHGSRSGTRIVHPAALPALPAAHSRRIHVDAIHALELVGALHAADLKPGALDEAGVGGVDRGRAPDHAAAGGHLRAGGQGGEAASGEENAEGNPAARADSARSCDHQGRPPAGGGAAGGQAGEGGRGGSEVGYGPPKAFRLAELAPPASSHLLQATASVA